MINDYKMPKRNYKPFKPMTDTMAAVIYLFGLAAVTVAAHLNW